MTDTATPVAAWYPDPAGVADLRWWDGTRWTGEVKAAMAAPPPAPPPPAAPQPAAPPQFTMPQAPAVGQPFAVLQPQAIPQPSAVGLPLAVPQAPAVPQPQAISQPQAVPPSASSVEDRAALYAARRDAHWAESSQGHDSASAGAGVPNPQFGTMPFGALPSSGQGEPDRFRVAYEEKSYQAWRKNSAANGALFFAALNLGLMVWAFVQHYEPYYRIVPSVIGIVTALVALRQARVTETGLVKAIVALIVNVLVGAVAAFAIVQLALGFATGDLSALVRPEDYSVALEEMLVEDTLAQGHPTQSVLCPEKVMPTVGAEYTCQEFHTDGTFENLLVAIREDDTIEYWFEG